MIGTGVKILADGGDISGHELPRLIRTAGLPGGNGGGGSGGAIRICQPTILPTTADYFWQPVVTVIIRPAEVPAAAWLGLP